MEKALGALAPAERDILSRCAPSDSGPLSAASLTRAHLTGKRSFPS